MNRLLSALLSLVVIAMCALLLWSTTQSLPVAALARMPALGISGAWFHAAISVFAALTLVFTLGRLVGSSRAGA